MKKKRVLVVDDDVELLNMMRGVLASWGYDVITAASGREAVRIVKGAGEFLDVIILDIVMPDTDGIATLRRIRRFNKWIPVLMLTGYASEERLVKTKRLGISGFMSKGPEFIESARVVKAALGRTKRPVVKKPKKKKKEKRSSIVPDYF